MIHHSTSNEFLLFLRSALSNPRQIGAIIPSTARLARLMSRYAHLTEGGAILELGAGTGVVTQALLDAGIPCEKLYVLELDPSLSEYLTKRFPGVNVINADATKSAEVLPSFLVGKISTVISSLPMRLFSLSAQQSIIQASFKVLASDGAFIQYTYPPGTPLHKAIALKSERLSRIWLNLPPAAVWRFTKNKI